MLSAAGSSDPDGDALTYSVNEASLPDGVTFDPATGVFSGAPTTEGVYEITVTANGHDFVLVNCHLKSKLLSYPGGRFFARSEDERARFGARPHHRLVRPD